MTESTTPAVKTQAYYDLSLRRFAESAKKFRETGYLRRVDKTGKAVNGIVKRSARLALQEFMNGTVPEGLMLSSKLAMVGMYDEIMEYLEETFHQDIDEKRAGEILGFDDPEYPLLCHDSSYGDDDENSIQKFKELFFCVENLPDYNIFHLIQISEKLKVVKLDDSDRVGFKNKKKGSYYTMLKKLHIHNQTKIAEGKEIKYLKIVNVAMGATPIPIKILPDSRLATYAKAEIEITLLDEPITMYLLLGKYGDNRAFLKHLAGELKVSLSFFDATLETMKTLAKIKRSTNPKEEVASTSKTPMATKTPAPKKPYTELKNENKRKTPAPKTVSKKKRPPPKRII